MKRDMGEAEGQRYIRMEGKRKVLKERCLDGWRKEEREKDGGWEGNQRVLVREGRKERYIRIEGWSKKALKDELMEEGRQGKNKMKEK